MELSKILQQYNTKDLTIGAIGSHSALDIASGAKKYGMKSLVVAQKGREKTYNHYYKQGEGSGCVDEVLALERFKDILKEENQEILRKKNVIFVPHRSFEVYLDFDYNAIEENFAVPIFGNRYLLKIEERGASPNQYDLLREAGIRIPKIFNDPKEIDCPVIVKVLEKKRGFERAFFLASSPEEYQKKYEEFLKKGIVTEEALSHNVIEEFILGVQVNLNYFYSPVFERLEFLGSDTRRQTNIEGLLKLPSKFQEESREYARMTFEEAGHIAVTILESMLEDVFEIGERFAAAAKKFYPSPHQNQGFGTGQAGIIGPFALQAFVLPGPPKKEFVVFDVSPRMPGSPGINATPYTKYLFGESFSAGERIAKEVKMAQERDILTRLLT